MFLDICYVGINIDKQYSCQPKEKYLWKIRKTYFETFLKKTKLLFYESHLDPDVYGSLLCFSLFARLIF